MVQFCNKDAELWTNSGRQRFRSPGQATHEKRECRLSRYSIKSNVVRHSAAMFTTIDIITQQTTRTNACVACPDMRQSIILRRRLWRVCRCSDASADNKMSYSALYESVFFVCCYFDAISRQGKGGYCARLFTPAA